MCMSTYKSGSVNPNNQGELMEKLFTADEVREALKVKMPTIRSWIHQGKLPVIKAGRSVRVRETVLIRSLKKDLSLSTRRAVQDQ